MSKVTKKLTSHDLYRQFRDSLVSFIPGSWTVAIFEGSPAGGLYSWCPDCVVASAHIRRFEASNAKGNLVAPDAKLLKFKVGSRKEWESKLKRNPFKAKFPFLSDVPTAILFFGKLDVVRVIAPQESDFKHMLERRQVYREQMRSKDWHPPMRFR